MWNERYNRPDYVYGKDPNTFLVQAAKYIKPAGSILSLGEGEGRNAVFLAGLGHNVTAVDNSIIGLQKTQKLADEKHVKIKTIEADLETYQFMPDAWDAIVSIFCHLPSIIRSQIHRNIIESLKKGGIFILESYSKQQLNYTSGGPKTDDMLLDLKTTLAELEGLDFISSKEIVREITEGEFHSGDGAVIQIIGRKI
jgi:SAM-dependent methyltransferase